MRMLTKMNGDWPQVEGYDQHLVHQQWVSSELEVVGPDGCWRMMKEGVVH